MSALVIGHPLAMTVQRLVVAGWVLVEEIAPPGFVGATVGDNLVTISDCLQPDLPRPDPWLGDWFQDRADAERVAASLGRAEVLVVTVAMDHADADDFMNQWGVSVTPWFDLLRQHRPLAPTATVLGYEIVGAEEYLDFHSWHCHGYAPEVREKLGITLNVHGLFDSRTQAQRALTWMLNRPTRDAPKEVPWTVAAIAI
jgi:hypothetical protein